MHIVVLGSGVVGVATAWSLQRDGHAVTVIDRAEEPAAFTSFANAGLVAPGHAYAWSSPGAPRMLLRSLWRGDQALRFRPNLDPALWRWTWKFLRQCTAERAALNTARKARLCLYSQSLLHEVVAASGVTYDARNGGLLYLYRRPESFTGALERMRLLTDQGIALESLTAGRTVALEPALAPLRDSLAGAIFAPGDESGDARLFTLGLAKACEAGGAVFRFGETVQGFRLDGGAVQAVVTDKGEVAADAFVLALGVYSPQIARQLGARLPIYPVKGYSVTLPVAGRNRAPSLGGVDEDNLVAYARFGERLRITATAEFAGYGTGHRPADFSRMLAVARDLFPQGGDYRQPSYWAGLRPMTPEGTPLLGRGRHANLYFNTGHGHMGWTMACGTAGLTADLIAGRKPAIPLDGLLLQ
ncbi:dadA2 [Symbiodinium necroappetens]|uniref:DadA2 protein n=1 Tax=Symbiodinium necroappetens TaxID=1628268 RepID=A0A812PJ37_9DINO|nr:dadA2 [Symbiodinium necroappetens]